MSKTTKPMNDVIAEETTTLPEGARISVFITRKVRSNKSGTTTSIKLRAYFENKTIDMCVEDGISAHSLKQYLELIVKEITRRRGMLSTKPVLGGYPHPKTIHEFVLSMAHNGMFILDDPTTAAKTL